jgi:hypothetical protein
MTMRTTDNDVGGLRSKRRGTWSELTTYPYPNIDNI